MGPVIKRTADFLLALLALLLLAPILAATALVVYLTMGSPVLFRQLRAGRNGKPFSVVKFRSMRDGRDAEGNLIPDEKRLTTVGQVIRRLKLDELPQLCNVLVGEMSLIGPRPWPLRPSAQGNPGEMHRQRVRPGMTGWAQVGGGTRMDWPERIALDIWYVDHWSLALDMVILIGTLRVVLLGEHPNPNALSEALTHAERTYPSGWYLGGRP